MSRSALQPAGSDSPGGRSASHYPRFREAFAEAMDSRLYTIGYLDRLLLSGKAQIWFGEKAAIVTEIRPYPTGARVIHGVVAAGDLQEIAEILIPKAEQWGRSIGCAFASIESRPGWAKALRSAGYVPYQLAIMKEL
jgi:hypothetical protein